MTVKWFLRGQYIVRLFVPLMAVGLGSLPSALYGQARMLADINLGPESSDPISKTDYAGALYFSADDGIHGRELWRYDPDTDEATLVADINPGRYSSGPASLFVFNNQLFFAAADFIHGSELRRYDAATGEVTLVADIYAGPHSSGPSFLVHYNDQLYFTADVHATYDRDSARPELWRYDPATDEITQVGAVSVASGFFTIYQLTVYNNRLYFRATTSPYGSELWSYDAATNQAALVADIRPGSGGSFLFHPTVYQGRLYFSAKDSTQDWKLWSHDAASGETVLVVEVNGGPQPAFPNHLAVYDGALYFTLAGRRRERLWRYQAATGEASLVTLPPGDDYDEFTKLIPYNEGLYFGLDDDAEHGSELWRYDAATDTTTLVAEIVAGPEGSRASWLAVAHDRLYFTANDGNTGRELWSYTAPLEVSVESDEEVPATHVLSPAYPNPFRTTTRFTLTVAHRQHVRVAVFDGLGRRRHVLYDGSMPAGSARPFTLSGHTLPSGLYLLRITGERFLATRPVLLMR